MTEALDISGQDVEVYCENPPHIKLLRSGTYRIFLNEPISGSSFKGRFINFPKNRESFSHIKVTDAIVPSSSLVLNTYVENLNG